MQKAFLQGQKKLKQKRKNIKMFGKHITVVKRRYDPIMGNDFYKVVLEIDGEIDELRKILVRYISNYYILEDGEISSKYNDFNHFENFDTSLEIR